MEKRFDVELEVLEKRQKKEIEKLEVQQINQFRVKSKQLKADQVHGAVCVQCRNRQKDGGGGQHEQIPRLLRECLLVYDSYTSRTQHESRVRHSVNLRNLS